MFLSIRGLIMSILPLDNHNQILHYQNKLLYEIDSWDLQKAIQSGENISIIDARSKEAYDKEHIPNAIHFSHKTINKETALNLLNFTIRYVTYCDGIGCNASTKSALKLVQLGYKVSELIGGIDWWKRDGYSTKSNEAVNPNNFTLDCGCEG